MKDRCVISCGQTQMTDVVGVSVPEGQGTRSGRIFQRHSVNCPSPFLLRRADLGDLDHNNGLTLVARAHQLVMEGFS